MRYGISFFGLGYVGLTTAICLAHKGFPVIGFDIDADKLRLINEAHVPFHEPRLGKVLEDVIKKRLFLIAKDYIEAVSKSKISFFTVGTPSKPDGSIDLAYIENVSHEVGKALKAKVDWHLIAVKSTVVPGTTSRIIRPLLEKSSGKKYGIDFGLCANPEFLREGSAVKDTLNPDRLIIGGSDNRSIDFLERMFRNFYGDKMPMTIKTSLENAELIKYTNNAFLSMKVSFINMISNLCQRLPNADVEVVAKGIGLDKRVGQSFLEAGIGWGGSCFPKDLRALKRFAEETGLDLPLVDATIKINDFQPYIMIELARKLIGDVSGSRISVLGLSFKPDTDDMREAVSIKIVNRLIALGAKVVVYDPMAIDSARRIFGERVEYASSALDCLRASDCALLVTEWNEFKTLTPEDFVKYMKTPAIVDGRRVFDPLTFSSKLRFQAIGLGLKEYLNSALAVNAIVVDRGKLLLVKRVIEPFKNLWSLPGGFVEYNEMIENALAREVEEETGLKVRPKYILNLFSKPLRSPVKHAISVCFVVEIVGGTVKGSDESSEVAFFHMNQLPPELAFDHLEIIQEYLKKQMI